MKQPSVLNSDDHDFEPKKKKPKMEVKLEMILDKMVNINETLGDAMSLTKIPLGLKHMMWDTFECHIIIMSLSQNVSYFRLFNMCQQLVQWAGGPDKTCPSCLAERSYNEIMLLWGLDNFLRLLCIFHVYPCASTLITRAIIISRTLLPCNLESISAI